MTGHCMDFRDYDLVWAEQNLLIFAYHGKAWGDDWDDSSAYCNAEPPYADQDLVYMPFYDSRNGLCPAERGSLTSSMEQALATKEVVMSGTVKVWEGNSCHTEAVSVRYGDSLDQVRKLFDKLGVIYGVGQ